MNDKMTYLDFLWLLNIVERHQLWYMEAERNNAGKVIAVAHILRGCGGMFLDSNVRKFLNGVKI
jgi:hypothetical protein